MNVIGDVKDQTCIIVDDIIDSGGTIINSAKALKARGAKEVYVYITHGVLSGDAVKKIKNSVIKNLVITDTIDNMEKTKNVGHAWGTRYQREWVVNWCLIPGGLNQLTDRLEAKLLSSEALSSKLLSSRAPKP